MTSLHVIPQRFLVAGPASLLAALIFITAMLFTHSANAQRPSVSEMQAQIDALTHPYDEPAAQVRTALELLPTFQDAVVRTYNQTGVPPQNRLEAGLSENANDTQTSFISAVDINEGVITFEFGNDADESLTGTRLSFVPFSSADDTVVWQCGHEEMIAGVSQLSHGGGGYNETDIPLSAQPNPCILKAYAYGQDLTINEQVLEPFELIETFKDAVETAAIALGSPSDPFAPANRTEAGLSASASDTIGHYFSSVSIHDGAIIVTYDGDDVNQAIWGDELVWTPHVSPDGTISWLCGYAYELTGTQPMDGSPGYNSTSIEPRYLPPQCRP